MMDRRYYLHVAVVVFAAGVASRMQRLDNDVWDKYLGDALYAVMFYLCLAICWPSVQPTYRVIVTSIFVVCIECFQLTGIPLDMRRNGNVFLKFVSIVLGTKFGWFDMLAYFVGITVVSLCDWRFTSATNASQQS